ncbi:MAG: hypothetical protein PUF50_02825 [Erysipelotrichaceae bacterium]|nr:hypothetical protein [Erysipelotrichaceae bacterium]
MSEKYKVNDAFKLLLEIEDEATLRAIASALVKRADFLKVIDEVYTELLKKEQN